MGGSQGVHVTCWPRRMKSDSLTSQLKGPIQSLGHCIPRKGHTTIPAPPACLPGAFHKHPSWMSSFDGGGEEHTGVTATTYSLKAQSTAHCLGAKAGA